MGARNVAAVLVAGWHELPYRARFALVCVAQMSLDAPSNGRPARRYFAGPEYLAQVLLGEVSDSSIAQVEKVLTQLTKAGALLRVVRGAPGRKAEYELVLKRPEPVEHPTETVGKHPTETVGDTPPERWEPTHQNGGAQEQGEEQQRRTGRTTSPDPAISPAPVDNSDAEQIDTETANRRLIHRHGLEHAMRLLDEHGATCPDCDAPARHLLDTPSFTVIKGGRIA